MDVNTIPIPEYACGWREGNWMKKGTLMILLQSDISICGQEINRLLLFSKLIKIQQN